MSSDAPVSDELDQLYRARPEEFTALRSELAAAAKKRKDADAAKQIAGARKPTTAAWVVNTLAHNDSEAVGRLRDLGSGLRAAHATGNGERIRALTAQQRKLVDELTKAALSAAGLDNPAGALRDDVHNTLQAAIADPDVTSRLGRLTKAEQWSGFGDIDDAAMLFAASAPDPAPAKTAVAKTASAKTGAAKPRRTAQDRRAERAAAQADADRAREKAKEQARVEAEQARADLAAAEQAKAKADDAVREQLAELKSARQRREEARRAFQQSERDLKAAEDAYESAEQAVHAAAKAVREARSRLKRR